MGYVFRAIDVTSSRSNFLGVVAKEKIRQRNKRKEKMKKFHK